MNYGYQPDTNIDYRELLRRVPQEKIWALVTGYEPTPFKRVTNPFRIDTHPGCWFEWGHTRLFLVDYADKRYHNMTCFDAVAHTYGTDFRETLILIDTMLDTGIASGRPRPAERLHTVREKKGVEFRTRQFAKVDRAYWEPFHISSRDLEYDQVMAIKWYRFYAKDGRPIEKDFYKPVPSYGIVFPNQHKKIYNPFLSKEEGKFITDCTAEDVGNWHDIVAGPLLLITKSYKDYRILRNLGYQVIWMQSESVSLSVEKIVQLSQMFDKIILLYDSDVPGKTAAERLAVEYNERADRKNFRWAILPTAKQKDPGEFITTFGRDELGRVVNQITHATQDHSLFLGANSC